MKNRRKCQREIELEVENWNLKYAVGTPVSVLLDSGEKCETVTRSKAQLLSGHTPVIWLEEIVGCYLLDRVIPRQVPSANYACRRVTCQIAGMHSEECRRAHQLACDHDRLNEDGICRRCGADRRGA